ncbi:ethanolamine utilization protein, possible chaperonin protecting lyase from inhibition [Desulfosporosinus orientis DSM 765]|uniref:Ethanolamine utilization protein, possible chaperonin protecting lyase from inhibition n=1 Tax=Desulfosporosinus orientis (strain ATCC 19365 / DSM 765 / NCIMB 8382 / VKM B-1628 / Singapore I) TaxID=768706 RepID=G7WB32_DESOD|nr:ethanolamine ammonia-lyase reactivating factor EutA [Desulfosporosinus orientis]AET67533.1 ethanolamine utilization protein, possible chaperonin protecting lyase from inhibition [Desulfosporosinus orientis DSM 765]
MAKEMTLVSVGIDVGTTTTQLVISQLTLVNVMPGSQVPKVEISHKSISYMGKVHFTPFEDRTHVDGSALRKIIAKEYEKAGVKPEEIDTGAIIITGETAKKENASEIIHSLADYAGDFVVATAGPDLESVIAGKGSGAEALSKHLHACIANIDIGGGTTNIAYFDRGKCIGTACINVGGRLFEVDPITQSLTFVSAPARELLNYCCSEKIKTSELKERGMIQDCLKNMVECVERVIFQEPLLEQDKGLIMTNLLPHVKIDGVVFSGGVARYIYLPGIHEWWIHGDVGPLLAEEFRRSRIYTGLTVHEGSETIHATVLGAGAHTVNVSGSTITVSEHTLPLRNMPAVYPEADGEGRFSWLKSAENYTDSLYHTLALIVPSLPNTDFSTILSLAEILAHELPLIKGEPKVVIAQQDIAKVLGQTLQRLLPATPLVCLDGIELAFGDFLDIAKPLPYQDAVPVIVKTLVFNS